MKLQRLVDHLLPCRVQDQRNIFDVEITSIHVDSRQVDKGSLFVCLEGFQADGHEFAQQAVQNGAVALLSQKPLSVDVPVIIVPDTRRALAYAADLFYGSPTRDLRLIGVTGTNGKTTITHLIDHILEKEGCQSGRMGTINMKIGTNISPLPNTTPESLDLQRSFHDMRRAGCSHAVIEVSSHAIDMGRVRGCNFGTVIFSNLTQDHLDYHGTMDEYKKVKGMLFAQLGNRIDVRDMKYAILNADDEASAYYESITPAQVLTYGIENEADIKATNIRLDPEGTSFSVEYHGEKLDFHVQLLGLFNVYNVLAALAAGIAEGLTLTSMRHSLSSVTGVRGRMEPVAGGQDFTVVVDYAHTPDSLENALQTVTEFAEGNIICLVGCGGDRDRGKRPLMAQVAARYAQMTVLTSDNPRSEDPQSIINDMKSGLISEKVPQNKYKEIINRKEAIHWAIKQAKAKDVIFIAGKGHETYQEVNGHKYDFDDIQVALEALRTGVTQRG